MKIGSRDIYSRKHSSQKPMIWNKQRLQIKAKEQEQKPIDSTLDYSNFSFLPRSFINKSWHALLIHMFNRR